MNIYLFLIKTNKRGIVFKNKSFNKFEAKKENDSSVFLYFICRKKYSQHDSFLEAHLQKIEKKNELHKQQQWKMMRNGIISALNKNSFFLRQIKGDKVTIFFRHLFPAYFL